MKKKLLMFITAILLLVSQTGCVNIPKENRDKDIVILFTNDIHAGIDENVSMASLSAYKNNLDTPYVALVDCGDAVQGNYLSASSKGTSIIQTMNKVGYDYAVIGNHEFDYQLSGLNDIIKTAQFQYLNCNITYNGSGKNPFEKTVPYAIKQFAGEKVAFIGITTPNTIYSSSPAYFKENDQYVVDFSAGDNGKQLYKKVQKAIDAVKNAGADYVVALAHLGVDDADEPFRSVDVIANTRGLDVLLDGHSHSVIEGMTVKDKGGNDVLLASTGTKLSNIGKLTIDTDGNISSQLISEYGQKDQEIVDWITKLEDVYQAFLGETKFEIQQDISIYDENNLRIVRVKETGIGDFVADAMRQVMQSDIALTNGGGVRSSLKAGPISQLDLIEVSPFGNMICVIEVTGSEIADMLEYFYSHTETDYAKDGVVTCESGSFAQISGMKCQVDTSVKPDIIVDEEDSLLSVGTNRRVHDIKVLQEGEYKDIDLNKTYTLAITDYIAKNGGSGMGVFLKDHKIVADDAISDYEALLHYAVDYLKGDLSAYYQPQDRIIIHN